MRARAVLPILLALAHPCVAQELATTLDALCRAGAPVVRVRALWSREEAGRLEVRLTVAERLRGDCPDTLILEEPAGRACGRALQGVAAGAGYLAFLDDSGHGLAVTSSRALVALEPGLVEHVRALLTAAGPDHVDLLAAALEHGTRRIRDDAALALQVAQGVERASPTARRRILTALARALPSAEGRVSALCIAASRTGDPAVAELLVPWYLRGERRDLDRVVGAALRRLDGRIVAHHVPGSLDAGTARRAVGLARLLAPPQAVPLLGALVRSDVRDVRVAAAAALLEFGAAPDDVSRLGATPDDVCDARRRLTEQPRFRSIEPRRIR